MNRKKASFIRCHLLSCSRNLAVTSTEKDKPLILKELAVLFVRLPVRENNVKRIMKRFVSKGFPGHPQPLLHRKQDWCHGV